MCLYVSFFLYLRTPLPRTKQRACLQNNNGYYDCHKDKKEGQTFKYLEKILHL
jgi:hypothetical protein